MMSSEYGRRITVNPMLLTWLSMAFQFADQMPCGIWLLVSKPNQLTPVNRTTLPAESTIFEPEVDQNPSPGAAAACCEAVSKIAAATRNGPAAHIRRRFMILSRECGVDSVSDETTSVLAAHEYDDQVVEQRLRRSQRAIARKSARSARTKQLPHSWCDAEDRNDRRAFRHIAMRRRFTPVRPASSFHAGPTCVVVSRRSDLRRFTAVRPASRFHAARIILPITGTAGRPAIRSCNPR